MKPIDIECVKCRLPMEINMIEDIPAIFSEYSFHGSLICLNCGIVNNINLIGNTQDDIF